MRKYCLYFFVICSFSCSPDLPDRNKVIEDLYNKRVQKLKKDKMSICRKNMLELATANVDSIVHELLNKDLNDTLYFPSRPIRPETPEHIIGTVKKFDLKDSIEY